MAKKRYNTTEVAKSYDDAFEAFNAIDSGFNNRGFASLGSQSASKFRGYNTGIGKSTYDENISWNADINEDDVAGSVNEYRAQNQPWGAKASAGVGRFLNRGISEILKLPGVAAGLIAAPFAEEGEGYDTAFNNSWIQAIDNASEEINSEILPVYVKKAVEDGDLWDKITSIDFWANEGADGLGYVAAMMVPGAAFEYAGLGSKFIGGLENAARAEKVSLFTENTVNAFKNLGLTPKKIDSVLAITGNTIAEAGAEAKGVGDDIDRRKDEFFSNMKSLNPNLTDEQIESEFKKQRAQAMADTFKTNVMVLIGPNALMHKAIWGSKGNSFARETDSVLKRINKSGQRYAQAFASEGLWEEGSQTTAQKYYTDQALKGRLNDDGLFSVFKNTSMGDISRAYIDTMSSTEGQAAAFLGGAFGGGMTSISGRINDVKSRKHTNAVFDAVDSQISSFVKTFNEDIYKKDEEGNFLYKKDALGKLTSKRELDNQKVIDIAKGLNYTEQQVKLLNFALENNMDDVVDSIKQRAVFDLIMPAVYNGEVGIKALEEKLQNDDSLLNSMSSSFSSKRDRIKNKEFIEKSLESAKLLQIENEKFKDFSKSIISLDNEDATEEDRKDYMNLLNRAYLQTKFNQFESESKLAEIEKKRKQAFEEIGIDPLYDSGSEFPMSKMKRKITEGDIVNNDIINERAERTKLALEKEGTYVYEINKQYNEERKKLDNYKKSLQDIWEGNVDIESNFDDFVKNRKKEQKQLEKAQEYQEIVDKVKSSESLNEVNDVLDENPESLENPIIKETVDSKIEEIKTEESEILQKQEQDAENDNFENANPVEVNKDLSFEQKDETTETNEEKSKKLSSDTKYKDLHKNNSRIISKEQKTGLKFDFVSQEWIDFENEVKDKTGTVLNFSINLNPGESKNLQNARDFAKLISNSNNPKDAIYRIVNSDKNNIKSEEELIEFLANYLPLNVSPQGKDNATAPIDTKPSTEASIEIFNKKDKLNRLKIVNALIQGISIENITTVVSGQMPGEIKVETDEEGNVVENEIKQLQYFREQGFTDENGKLNSKGYSYIRQNLFYVNDQGQFVNAKGDTDLVYNKEGELLSKGEFYLQIPMTNGEKFNLKLNTKKVSEIQANVLYEIYKYRFNPGKVLSKDVSLKTVKKESPDLYDIITNLDEYKLISSIKSESSITLKDIIDILIYDGSSNKKSRFKFGGTGILNENGLFYGNNAPITNIQEFENNRENIISFLMEEKRRSVLFGGKKNLDSKKVSTHNNLYIDYLFDNKVLNTNAVVGVDENGKNKVTFGGYTNLYFSKINIKQKEQSKPKQASLSKEELQMIRPKQGEVVLELEGGMESFLSGTEFDKNKKSELEDKKADIERRRQEELNRALSDVNELRQADTVGKAQVAMVKATQESSLSKAVDNAGIIIGESVSTQASTNIIGVAKRLADAIEKIQKPQVDKINAKYDTELNSLKEKSITTISDIEAKKTEIERRRQEKLTKLVLNIFPDTNEKSLFYHGGIRPYSSKDIFRGVSNGKGMGDLKDKNIYFTKDLAIADRYVKSALDSENNYDTSHHIKTVFLNNPKTVIKQGEIDYFVSDVKDVYILNKQDLDSVNKINAKYDAELFALENNVKSELNILPSQEKSLSLPENTNAFGTNPNFSHEIKGTEENKVVESIKNESKKEVNLSEEDISAFFKLENFLKLMSDYVQDNGIKESDLTLEDFQKIIDKNYTIEEIDKICKGK